MKKSKRSGIGAKIGTGLLVLLCLLLVVLLVWVCVDKFVYKSPVTKIFGHSMLRILTGSMTGTANEGDFVIIKEADDYAVGEVITFIPKGSSTPTTHRIKALDEAGDYITKGDANDTQDTEHINKSQVLGRVTHIIPAGAAAAWFFEMGWLYIMAMILIVVMGVVLLKYDSALTAQKAEAATDAAEAATGAAADADDTQSVSDGDGTKCELFDDTKNENN